MGRVSEVIYHIWICGHNFVDGGLFKTVGQLLCDLTILNFIAVQFKEKWTNQVAY